MKGPFKTIRLFLLLFFLNLIIFVRVFPSFFYVDEFELIYSQRFGSIQELIFRIFASSTSYLFRPMYYLMFGLYYKICLFNMAYCYALPFLAHFIAAISVYYFLLRDENDSSFAAIGSILFIIYCGVWEAVGSISGILYPMTAIFLLNAFICYFNRRYWFSFLLFAMGLLTHEVSIMFVPLVLLYERMVNNKRMSLSSFKGLYASSLLTIAFLFFYFFKKLFFHAAPMSDKYVIGPHFFWNELNYIATLFIPIITSYRMQSVLPGTIIKAIDLAKLGVVCLVPFGILAVFLYGPGKAKFFTCWGLLTLLPFSFFITPAVSRYLYIASIGYIAGVVLFIDHLLRSDKYKKIGIIIFTLLFVGNIGGMYAYQKLFYNKKEVRRQIINDVIAQAPKIKLNSRICFIDLPIRDDEIKNMIYLWYKSDRYKIYTINADNVPYRRGYDPKRRYSYDYVFVYNCAGGRTKLVNGRN